MSIVDAMTPITDLLERHAGEQLLRRFETVPGGSDKAPKMLSFY